MDNDGDGVDDFPTDPGCSDLFDTDETGLVIAYPGSYPYRRRTGSPKPIFVIANVTDEWGTPVTNATVAVTAPISLAMAHNGGGVYGNGAGSCASGGDVSGGGAQLITVTAIHGSESASVTLGDTSYPGACP